MNIYSLSSTLDTGGHGSTCSLTGSSAPAPDPTAEIPVTCTHGACIPATDVLDVQVALRAGDNMQGSFGVTLHKQFYGLCWGKSYGWCLSHVFGQQVKDSDTVIVI